MVEDDVAGVSLEGLRVDVGGGMIEVKMNQGDC